MLKSRNLRKWGASIMGRPRTSGSHLPLCVYKKHGAYYHVEGGKWTRLGKTIDDAMASINKMSAKEWKLFEKKWIQYIFWNSRKNAKSRNIQFDLTMDDVRDMVKRSGGRCSVSGIFFDFTRIDGCRRRPWVPSIDRIDSKKPYVKENIRLVCSSVNYAMNEWGVDILFRISSNMKRKKTLSN